MRNGNYARQSSAYRPGSDERLGRDHWAGNDRSGPGTGYGGLGGYEGEYGGYGGYGRARQGMYGTGAGQGGETGGYQRGTSYGVRRILPKGYTRSDDRILEDVCEQLSHSGLDVSDVSVKVANGQVVLEGTVNDRQVKHAIEDCADDCTGVQDVDNRIRVQRESSMQSPPGAGNELGVVGGSDD